MSASVPLTLRIALVSGDCFVVTIDPRPSGVQELKSRIRERLLERDVDPVVTRPELPSEHVVMNWRLVRKNEIDGSSTNFDDEEFVGFGAVAKPETSLLKESSEQVQVASQQQGFDCDADCLSSSTLDTEGVLSLNLLVTCALTSLDRAWFDDLHVKDSWHWMPVCGESWKNDYGLIVCGAMHDSLPVEFEQTASAGEVFQSLITATKFQICDPHKLYIAEMLGTCKEADDLPDSAELDDASDDASDPSEAESDGIGWLQRTVQVGQLVAWDEIRNAGNHIAASGQTLCSRMERLRGVDIDAVHPGLAPTMSAVRALAAEFVGSLVGNASDSSMVLFTDEQHNPAIRLGFSGGLCWHRQQACFMLVVYVERY